MKSAVRDQEGDLQEQLTFLANEKNNLTELERLIADLVISLLTRSGSNPIIKFSLKFILLRVTLN